MSNPTDSSCKFIEMSPFSERLNTDQIGLNLSPDPRRCTDKKTCPEHSRLSQRLKKSLYYGKLPSTERPSLPMTEIAVEFYRDVSPREFGRIDTSYAAFVARRACISPCSMVLGMIYIDRLRQKNTAYLHQTSSSDLFLISMMMASKFLYDNGSQEEVFNDEWAASASLDVDDLNRLERSFLHAIDWDLFVRPDDFWNMLTRIEKRIAWHQATDRGWFSYSDLYILTDDFQPHKLIYAWAVEIVQMFMVVIVAYVASIMTMIGSTALVTSLQSQLWLLHDLLAKHQAGADMASQLEIVPPFHLQRDHHIVDMMAEETIIPTEARNPVLETIADQSAARIQERILGRSLPNGVPVLNSLSSLGTGLVGGLGALSNQDRLQNHVTKNSFTDYVCQEGACVERLQGCRNVSSLRCRNARNPLDVSRCEQCRQEDTQCCCRLRPVSDSLPRLEPRFVDLVGGGGFRTGSVIRT